MAGPTPKGWRNATWVFFGLALLTPFGGCTYYDLAAATGDDAPEENYLGFAIALVTIPIVIFFLVVAAGCGMVGAMISSQREARAVESIRKKW